MATLGRRTAELHRDLTRPGGGPAFDPEPLVPDDLQAWSGRIRKEAVQTLQRLRQAGERADLPEPRALRHAEQLLAHGERLASLIEHATPAGSSALKTRIHGDLHLGQVLVVEDDVVFIDFEGEPKRPLDERRAKHSPLVDVAGMLRSFDYAAHSALEGLCRIQPDARERAEAVFARWHRQITETFLEAYHEAAAGSASYPQSRAEAAALIELFSLEKALYEVRYELDSRPEWVDIPLQGLIGLLEARAA